MTVSGVSGSSSSTSSASAIDAHDHRGQFRHLPAAAHHAAQEPEPARSARHQPVHPAAGAVLRRRAAAQDQRLPVVAGQANANTVNSNAVELYRQDRHRLGRAAPSSPTARRSGTSSLTDAANVTVNIKDANGNVVYTETGTHAGRRRAPSPGTATTAQGNTQPDGTYSISMQAIDAEGKIGQHLDPDHRRRHRRRFHRHRAGAAGRQHARQPLGRHLGRQRHAAVVTRR